MKIKDIALSAAAIGERVVKAIAIGAVEVWSAVKYIIFKDKVVEQICATNWGDGKGITDEQAAAVTDIGTVFKGNTEIVSFEEFENFTSVTSLGTDRNYSGNKFQGCTSLTRITLPPSLTIIGGYTFDGCTRLSEIGPFDNVERLYAWCFRNTNLSGSVSFPKLKSMDYGEFTGTKITHITDLGEVTKIGGQMPSTLEVIKIPKTCKVIDENTFNNCKSLRDIGTDLSHVEQLGTSSFYYSSISGELNMENLRSVAMSCLRGTNISKVLSMGSIKNLAIWTLMECKQLKEVVLPYTLTDIGQAAFHGDKALEKLVVHATVPPTLTNGPFVNSSVETGGCLIYVPDQSVTAYREASGWSAYASQIKPMSEYVEPTNG